MPTSKQTRKTRIEQIRIAMREKIRISDLPITISILSSLLNLFPSAVEILFQAFWELFLVKSSMVKFRASLKASAMFMLKSSAIAFR